MKRLFSFMVGSAMGAAIGAAVALLLTPYSGAELRRLAREAADERREELESRLRELRAPRVKSSAPEEDI